LDTLFACASKLKPQASGNTGLPFPFAGARYQHRSRPQHEVPPVAPSTAPSPPGAVSHRAVAVAVAVAPPSPWTDPRRRPAPSPAAGGLPVRRRPPRRRCDVVRSLHRIPVVPQIFPLSAFLVGKICHLPRRPTLSAPQRCARSSTRASDVHLHGASRCFTTILHCRHL
jgi:hypothetical protein